MTDSVRGSTAFGVALALAFGVASGWLLGSGEDSEASAGGESWLFSHTADVGEIREAGDGSLELVLRSFDDQVMAFTDRPFREAKIESVEWLVSLWDELFADSPPNGVVVEHDPDGTARSVVVELSSPRLSGDELTYAVTVLDALPEGRLSRVAGVLHDSPVRSFRAVSVFIDDVSLSCAQGGACAVGDTGPGGGKVFSVGSSGSYLEAAPADLSGQFTWLDAVKQARNYQGGGKADWYLPSKDELNQLYVQSNIVGGLAVGSLGLGYWSSSEVYFDDAANRWTERTNTTGGNDCCGFAVDSVEAWYQYFGGGTQYRINKDRLNQVRPIRAG